MSKPSSRKPKREIRETSRRTHHDRGVYIGLLIIVASIVGFAFLVFEGRWQESAILCAIVIIGLINLCGWSAFQGHSLTPWKQALARIPLRFAGYGTKEGKPLAAANHSEAAKKMLVTFGIISAVLIAVLVYLLVPYIQSWLSV